MRVTPQPCWEVKTAAHLDGTCANCRFADVLKDSRGLSRDRVHYCRKMPKREKVTAAHGCGCFEGRC